MFFLVSYFNFMSNVFQKTIIFDVEIKKWLSNLKYINTIVLTHFGFKVYILNIYTVVLF